MWLTTEFIKAKIIDKVMSEFKKRGLDVKYQKKIEAWKKHKREKEYSKRMERQVLDEVERFIKERDNR